MLTMVEWEKVKKDRDLISQIDWDMTPRQAFEAYQLKSKDNWRHRSLGEVVYFYLSTWQGNNRVLLVRRGLVQSEELAQAPAPSDMVAACAASQEGEQYPRGQIPLDEALKNWLRKELGV
jgi:hypothetical protein